eukprot:GILJ01005402.1.p1 GENE.GILJ01005402.1~~GILJ01005402.1.p1  ORF type:complete len:2699 (+),score=503.77 GILJ01005402.1:46-8097(+)
MESPDLEDDAMTPEPRMSEEMLMRQAIQDQVMNRLTTSDQEYLTALLNDTFSFSVELDRELVMSEVWEAAAHQAIQLLQLQPHPAFIAKTLQLLQAGDENVGVLVVGDAGTAKSKLILVQHVVRSLLSLEPDSSLNIDDVIARVHRIYPLAMSNRELFGESDKKSREWKDGLVGSQLRSILAEEHAAHEHLIVFDGSPAIHWADRLQPLLDERTLFLDNGERVQLPLFTRVMFETDSLADSTPSAISRCGLMFLHSEDSSTWKAYANSFFLNRVPDSVPVWAKMHLCESADKYLEGGLNWVKDHGKFKSQITELQMVESICQFISALIEPQKAPSFQSMNQSKDSMPNLFSVQLPFEWSTAEATDQNVRFVDMVFCLSFVWGLGGSLDSTTRVKFDLFTRGHLDYVTVPGKDSLFDSFLALDENGSVTWKSWSEIVPRFICEHIPSMATALSSQSLFVHDSESIRYWYLLHKSIQKQIPVLLRGDAGSGKSVMIRSLLRYLHDDQNKVVQIPIHFTSNTDAKQFQLSVESKLQKIKKSWLGAPAGKQAVVFIDDVNMGSSMIRQSGSPLEMLRQLLDVGGVYDRSKLFWKQIKDTAIISAISATGSKMNHNELPSRLNRHFTTLSLATPDRECMKNIYLQLLQPLMSRFNEVMKPIGVGLVESAIELYERTKNHLTPTPSRPHYLFNLRDLTRLIRGLLLGCEVVMENAVSGTITLTSSPHVPTQPEPMIRLWLHEALRVFHDPLSKKEDQNWLVNTLHQITTTQFNLHSTFEEMFPSNKPIMYCDFQRSNVMERSFEDVKDSRMLMKVLEDYLEEHNSPSMGNRPMKLVFFLEAVQHVIRIARILRHIRGHAMLVGPLGTGRRSLTRLVAALGGFRHWHPAIKSGNHRYCLEEFLQDIKKHVYDAGVAGKKTVLVFTDLHLQDDAIVQQIYQLMQTGEPTNLFTHEEKETLLEEMRSVCKNLKKAETRENCYSTFVSRVIQHVHIILNLSPDSDMFKSRIRGFPGFFELCQIDWFFPWTNEVLKAVAVRTLPEDMLGGWQSLQSISEVCVNIHQSACEMAEKASNQIRRAVSLTYSPLTYTDFLDQYPRILTQKRLDLQSKLERMSTGLKKLDGATALTQALQEELFKLQPVLEQKIAETQTLLRNMEYEQHSARELKERVADDEFQVRLHRQQMEGLQTDAQQELDIALPAYHAAVEALSTLDRKDIVEIRSMPKPPPVVQTVVEAVLILLGERSDWENAKRVLQDVAFMKRLVEIDKDNIPKPALKRIQTYVEHPDFNPLKVEQVSKAARSLCMWVRAIDTYCAISVELEPKREKLKEMSEALQTADSKLKEKQELLKNIEIQIEDLRRRVRVTEEEKDRLQGEINITQARLSRAEKLTVGLSTEIERWRDGCKKLQQRTECLRGDMLLAAGCVSYCGPLNHIQREDLMQRWALKLLERQFNISAPFSVQAVLGDPVKMRDWAQHGLSRDSLSVENALIVSHCRRFPLLIDPQRQAASWLRSIEQKNQLQIVKPHMSSTAQTLERCIRLGHSLLVEDVSDSLDPCIFSALHKHVFSSGGKIMLKLNEQDVELHPNFRMFLISKQSSMLLPAEVAALVTEVNFLLTQKSLEENLLAEVTRREIPDIEDKYQKIQLSMSTDQQQINELEERILRLLVTASGNILDDEDLIDSLSESKRATDLVNDRMKESKTASVAIRDQREKYRPIAARGSLLYFVTVDLAALSPMYQFSLYNFLRLFTGVCDHHNGTDSGSSSLDAVMNLPKKQLGVEPTTPRSLPQQEDVNARIETIIYSLQNAVFVRTARALMPEHRRLFAFLAAIALQKQQKAVSDVEYNTLLKMNKTKEGTREKEGLLELQKLLHTSSRGGSRCPSAPLGEDASQLNRDSSLDFSVIRERAGSPTHLPDNLPAFVTAREWEIVHVLRERIHDFERLPQDLIDNAEGWKAFVDHPTPFTARLPGDWEDRLSRFLRLCLIKALCDHKLTHSIDQFIQEQFGEIWLSNPAMNVRRIYRESDKITPIVIILSEGNDPTRDVIQLMRDQHGERQLHIETVVKGKETKIMKQIEQAWQRGEWILLQNVHLTEWWLPQLEQCLESIVENMNDIHPDFRLWITTESTPHFPVHVLHASIKVTNHSASCVSESIIQQYSQLPAGLLRHHQKPDLWGQTLFGLCMFHALLNEKNALQSVGFTVKYEFRSGHFERAVELIHAMVGEKENISEDIKVVLGQIEYGSIIADPTDRRYLMSLMKRCFNPESISLKEIIPMDDSTVLTVPELTNLAMNSDRVCLRLNSGFFSAGISRILGVCPRATVEVQRTVAVSLLDDLQRIQGATGPELDVRRDDSAAESMVSEIIALLSSILPAEISQLTKEKAFASLLTHKSPSRLANLENNTNVPLSPNPPSRVPSRPPSRPVVPSRPESKISRHTPHEEDRMSSNDMPLVAFWNREIATCNRLLQVMRDDMQDLSAAIKGSILLSGQLQQLFYDISNHRAPSHWLEIMRTEEQDVAEPLGLFTNRLIERCSMICRWLNEGTPACYNLSLIIHPKRLFSALLQEYARTNRLPFDRVAFQTIVTAMQSADEIEDASTFIYIHGLYLQGANWDPIKQRLDRCTADQMTAMLPVLQLNPIEGLRPTEGAYKCPVFERIDDKLGSESIELSLELPTHQPIDDWILAGVSAVVKPIKLPS